MSVIELTEKELLEMLKERIKKAQDMGMKEMYDEHVKLLTQFELYKKKGYVIKCYLYDDTSLVVIPYTKNEYMILEKKYREAGIW